MTIGRIPTQALSRLRQIDRLAKGHGHARFWDRAFSRRQFVTAAASAASVLLARPLGAVTTDVRGNTPKPIPGGFIGPGNNLFHVFVPNVLHTNETDRSLITDFKGQVGFAVIDGTGTARTGKSATRLAFEVDSRFMQGIYIGEDGRSRQGTFCFT